MYNKLINVTFEQEILKAESYFEIQLGTAHIYADNPIHTVKLPKYAMEDMVVGRFDWIDAVQLTAEINSDLIPDTTVESCINYLMLCRAAGKRCLPSEAQLEAMILQYGAETVFGNSGSLWTIDAYDKEFPSIINGKIDPVNWGFETSYRVFRYSPDAVGRYYVPFSYGLDRSGVLLVRPLR